MKKKKSFSLIELLVVIAIVAILAGLLLPALNKARNSAFSSGCISVQKQIGTAQSMYSADWNEWILPNYAQKNDPYGIWPAVLSGWTAAQKKGAPLRGGIQSSEWRNFSLSGGKAEGRMEQGFLYRAFHRESLSARRASGGEFDVSSFS